MRGRVRGYQGRIGGHARRAGAIAGLVLAITAGLVTASGGAPSALAATAPAASTKATASQSARPARKPAKLMPSKPSASQVRQAAAGAARQAIAHATVPDTCSGLISPDTIYPCRTPSSSGTDTFTFTLADTSDLVYVRVLSTSGNALGWTLTAPDNSSVSCQEPAYVYECTTSQAGTYTLAVANGGTPYTVDFTPLVSDTTCSALDLSFTAGPTQGNLADGQTGACYTLAVSSGSVIAATWQPSVYPTNVDVFDATGTNQECNFDGVNCTLGGTAPYRVFVSTYGVADSYQIEVNNLTDPTGCVATSQITYGQVPDSSSTDPCRTLTVTAAGSYQFTVVGPGNPALNGTLYAASGTPACAYYQYPFCPLSAGTYHWVTSVLQAPIPFGLAFIAGSESRGCTSTDDTGFASGPATGKFTGIGEELCLNLPTASGKADYLFNQPPAQGANMPSMEVVDATGALQCGNNADFSYATCALAGKAPFRVILSGGAYATAYRVLAQRTDSSKGCAAWPRSGFGGSWGATVTLTAVNDVKCLTIPASQHSTGEMIDYSDIKNVVDGGIYVNDSAGTQVCFGTSAGACSYKPGVTYTALMFSTGKGDTYHLVRRDVSKTAKCAALASGTAVGAPSTAFTLTSDLDTVCYRVTAASADKFWFSVRTLAPSPGGAVLQVTDPTGKIICRQFLPACMLTRSSDYQLVVTASGYSGVAITAHLDTWLVGTASGWAAQCQAHHLTAASGFREISGTLTEKDPGYCGVINVAASQQFSLPGVETNVSYPVTADLDVYRPSDWSPNPSSSNGICSGNYGVFGVTCSAYSTNQAFQGLLLLSLGKAQSGTGYTFQGACKIECSTPFQQATLGKLSPAKAPAGFSEKIVITGANLTLATQFTLASNGVNVATGTNTAVNTAGTQLTVLVSTSGLTPGSYDGVLDSPGYTTGTPSPGYLPHAYTVTAASPAPTASGFTSVRPARVLNTLSGLGVKKAKVAAHGAVTLTVAGKGGVPAKNVTAVALDVTAIGPTAGGSLIAYPAGTSRPAVTSLSFASRQTVTTLVIVALSGGKATLYNASGGTLDLTADVVGFYAPTAAGSTLTTTGPSPILDTRSGLGAKKAKVTRHGTVTLAVAGKGGVPAKNVTAVLLNVAAVSPAEAGSLTIYQNGISRPVATSLSFAAGKTTYGLVVAGVAGGTVNIYNASGGTLDLEAEVVGYYGTGGASFLPVGAQRVLDTRSGLGGGGQAVLPAAVTVLGNAGNIIPSSLSVSSVVLDVTVTSAQRAGTLTVFPDGASLPAPTFSYAAGQTVTRLVIVPDVDGSIDFYNGSSGTIQVAADLIGYNG
jgi:hypothetical protein